MILLVLGMVVFGIVLICVDGTRSVTKVEPVIERNDYGKGKRTEELDIKIDEEKVRSKVEISELQYSEEEIEALFDRIIRRMDRMIQGENETLEHVDHNLDLVTEVPGEPVRIRWELDRYDVMNSRGELQDVKIKKEGVVVNLTAILTYTENEKKQKIYYFGVHVYPKKLTGAEKRTRDIDEKLKAANEKNPTKVKVTLPGSLNGKRMTYYQPFNYRGMVIVAMGILIGILLIAQKKQNRIKEQDERKKQMLRDYPGLSGDHQ